MLVNWVFKKQGDILTVRLLMDYIWNKQIQMIMKFIWKNYFLEMKC